MLDDAEKGLLIANYIASPLLDMYKIDSSTLRFVQMDHLGTVLICSGNGKKCSRDNCDSSNDKNVRSTTTANDTPFFDHSRTSLRSKTTGGQHTLRSREPH